MAERQYLVLIDLLGVVQTHYHLLCVLHRLNCTLVEILLFVLLAIFLPNNKNYLCTYFDLYPMSRLGSKTRKCS